MEYLINGSKNLKHTIREGTNFVNGFSSLMVISDGLGFVKTSQNDDKMLFNYIIIVTGVIELLKGYCKSTDNRLFIVSTKISQFILIENLC